MQRSIFQNISPLDHRYSLSEKDVFDALMPYLSEEASISACVKAEIALIIAHLRDKGRLTEALRAALIKLETAITPEEVYAEEEKTRHNIRALVNVLKTKLPEDVAPLAHLGATSVDILDTAFAWRVKKATLDIALPLFAKLELLLCDIAEREADTPQVGRTHGQHAVPVTVGFAFAEYVARAGKSIIRIRELAADLRGKLAGAVGAYNATALLTRDPLRLEQFFLDEMDLLPSEHSTQLAEPEHILRLLLEFNVFFGIIANLADDLRNLQRSEIAEIRESFSSAQVGSSTMPQKRNPWNSEHVKSMWKAFMPRVLTFFMDQISEHQRDLTNSASQRFIAEYITGLCMACERMRGVLAGLAVDRENLMRNLRNGSASGMIRGGILAEPAYILLAESGENGAHEYIRKITLACEKEGLSFAAGLMREKEVFAKITAKLMETGVAKSEAEATAFFEHPERYNGLAAHKARSLAEKYRRLLKKWQN
ncbi:MAG: adenylosuccinate lyase [Spirochaetaceae bacterium]|jgi:adenylosuccinate lyase|nr:adenylosuccinate lyase [Spirochaetaceae bacterium]